jgi:hypothetical protein
VEPERLPAVLISVATAVVVLLGSWWWRANEPAAAGGHPPAAGGLAERIAVAQPPGLMPVPLVPDRLGPPQAGTPVTGSGAGQRVDRTSGWARMADELLPPAEGQRLRGAFAVDHPGGYTGLHPDVEDGRYELEVVCAGVGAVVIVITSVGDGIPAAFARRLADESVTWWRVPCAPYDAHVHRRDFDLVAGSPVVAVRTLADGTIAEVRYAASPAGS